MYSLKTILASTSILAALSTMAPAFAQTTPGSLRSPCINTAVAGPVPNAFTGGENLFSGHQFDDALSATELSEPVIVRLVMEGLGIFRDIALVEFDFRNACAAIDTSTNQRVIYFDREWLDNYSEDDFWIKVGIFAHELGHHVNNHTYESDSVARIRREHEADIFAGAAIAALGGTLENALAFASKQPSRWSNTHPGRGTRQSSIREGYERVAQVKSRILLFSGQSSTGDPAVAVQPEVVIQTSRSATFSRALTSGMLNTLRSPADPVFSVEGAHETKEANGETTRLTSLPQRFVPSSDSDNDVFLGNVFGGVSRTLMEQVVDNYVEEYMDFFWDTGPGNRSLRKPSVTLKTADTSEIFSISRQNCDKPVELTKFLENYFIFINLYASFYERALGSDRYITVTGDDFHRFKDDGYIESPVFSSNMSIDHALKSGFAPVLEKLLLSVFSNADPSWKFEVKDFLVSFLEYQKANDDLISTARLDISDGIWVVDSTNLASPFGCNSDIPRLYAEIRSYGSPEDETTSYLGSERTSMKDGVETRIVGFWVRRKLEGTDQTLIDSINRLIAGL